MYMYIRSNVHEDSNKNSWKNFFTSINMYILLNDVFFFAQRGGTMEELFAYIFGIYIKFGYKDPSILAPSNSVNVAT